MLLAGFRFVFAEAVRVEKRFGDDAPCRFRLELHCAAFFRRKFGLRCNENSSQTITGPAIARIGAELWSKTSPAQNKMKNLGKILIVDDEPLVLAAYERALRGKFALVKAADGSAGMEAVAKEGPFAVVVSDLHTAFMDGYRFFAQVREIAPETVRAILTSEAELQRAIDAVNEGNAFRFLVKPCSADGLASLMTACVEQYHLVIAEKEILERTLRGIVQVLTEALSRTNPRAFGRAQRIREYVVQITEGLRLDQAWRYELAALLSQLGCTTLAPEMLEAACGGKRMTAEEQRKFAGHPQIAANLLKGIPRLELVAEMIAAQGKPGATGMRAACKSTEDAVNTGARMLRLAGDLDDLVRDGLTIRAALGELRNRADGYDPVWLDALEDLDKGTEALVQG